MNTDEYENMTWKTPSDELEDAVENLLVEVKRLRKRLEVIEHFINDELKAFVNSNTFDHIYDAFEKKLEE